MATDYDAPRRTESDDATEDSLEERKEHRNDAAASIIDIDEADTAESFELPGADLSGEELPVRVVPNKPTSSPARPASWSTTDTATPANAQVYRSAATARHNPGAALASSARFSSSRRPRQQKPVGRLCGLPERTLRGWTWCAPFTGCASTAALPGPKFRLCFFSALSV